MKIGIYGGSFNPIHYGHIGLVKWVAEHSDLDEVWLMVSPNNPLKMNADLMGKFDLRTNYSARVSAAEKVLAEVACTKVLRVSDFENGLPRPSYTANTLRELQKAYPEDEFSLIVGADNWALMEQWREYEYVLSNYRIFVYPRQGVAMGVRSELPKGKVIFCEGAPLYDVSSTEMRAKDRSREELANTWTHLLALIGAIGVSGPLIRLAVDRGALAIVGTVLFIAGMLLMFTSSTLYHAIQNPIHKTRLRVFDHVSIYAMIAGSYSLLCVYVVGGWMGWTLFGFLWACVLAGTIGKFVALGRYPRLSLSLYLLMGWVALLIMRPMWLLLSHAAFWWILTEGLLYTGGAYFFRGDEQHRYWHAIWHVFIVLGALCHTIATWLILTNG